jgi:hypothetical protein
MHDMESPLAGSVVRLSYMSRTVFNETFEEDIVLSGRDFSVVDWWDRVGVGGSWKEREDQLSRAYLLRKSTTTLPDDDNVLYGRVDNKEVLVHVNEVD